MDSIHPRIKMTLLLKILIKLILTWSFHLWSINGPTVLKKDFYKSFFVYSFLQGSTTILNSWLLVIFAWWSVVFHWFDPKKIFHLIFFIWWSLIAKHSFTVFQNGNFWCFLFHFSFYDVIWYESKLVKKCSRLFTLLTFKVMMTFFLHFISQTVEL